MVLGQPNTSFNVFVAVRPISPAGAGVFPQFPPVSVDPVSREWIAEAQIGSEESQASDGDVFEILTFVTNANLTPGTAENPTSFPRPVDIPGVVHISRFIRLTVGSRGNGLPFVSLVAPPDSACEGLTPRFQWRIENRDTSVIYCSNIITDKGLNPFDGMFEALFYARQATELQVSLDPNFYDPASFEWGVRVTACDDPSATCNDSTPPCLGQSFDSNIFQLRTSSVAPNCP
jgi:hypothetical protein